MGGLGHPTLLRVPAGSAAQDMAPTFSLGPQKGGEDLPIDLQGCRWNSCFMGPLVGWSTVTGCKGCSIGWAPHPTSYNGSTAVKLRACRVLQVPVTWGDCQGPPVFPLPAKQSAPGLRRQTSSCCVLSSLYKAITGVYARFPALHPPTPAVSGVFVHTIQNCRNVIEAFLGQLANLSPKAQTIGPGFGPPFCGALPKSGFYHGKPGVMPSAKTWTEFPLHSSSKRCPSPQLAN